MFVTGFLVFDESGGIAIMVLQAIPGRPQGSSNCVSCACSGPQLKDDDAEGL